LKLQPSLGLANHSPTGFAWGYEGSGPAQLALAILLHFTGHPAWALAHYQDFKRAIIAKLPRSDFQIETLTVRNWIRDEYRKEGL